jgi:ABC-2 type transport system permease protein
MARETLVSTYVHTAATAIRASFTDRANFLIQAGGMIVNDGFMLTLWFMFFAGFHSVGGWRLADMALLYGMIMTIVGAAGVFFGGYRDMAATILSGEIDALLTQPRSVLARVLARDSIPTAWGDLFCGIVVLIFFAGITAQTVSWFVIGWTAGLTVYLSAAVTYASAAFWMRGARSLARDLTDFTILASSYPGSVYSGASKIVAYTVLPAGFIVLTPVHMLRQPGPATLAIMLGAAAAYAAVAIGLFQFGLRRYRRGSAPTTGA